MLEYWKVGILGKVKNNGLLRHAGPEQPAPYLIRGHPEALEKAGFRLSPE